MSLQLNVIVIMPNLKQIRTSIFEKTKVPTRRIWKEWISTPIRRELFASDPEIDGDGDSDSSDDPFRARKAFDN